MFRYSLLFLSVFCFSQQKDISIQSLIENKEYDRAKKQLVLSIDSKDNIKQNLEFLGDVYALEKDWDSAAVCFGKLKQIDNLKADYFYKYGGALGMKALSVNKFSALKLITPIKEAFLKAAKLDEKHIEVRWALVQFYAQLPSFLGGGEDEALKYANELENLSEIDGLLAKGYVYTEFKDLEKGKYVYTKALTLGGSETCYKDFANFYLEVNQKKEAYKILKEGIFKQYYYKLILKLTKLSEEENFQKTQTKSLVKNLLQYHPISEELKSKLSNFIG